MEKKERVIHIRLSESEYELISLRSKDNQCGISEYVRHLIKQEIDNKYIGYVSKKGMVGSKKKNYIFRITEAEYDHLRRLSQVSGISASGILRSMICKTDPPRLLSTEDKTLIVQLKRIGNNINQIAAVANTTQTIDELYLRENIADLKDVLDSIRSIYGV